MMMALSKKGTTAEGVGVGSSTTRTTMPLFSSTRVRRVAHRARRLVHGDNADPGTGEVVHEPVHQRPGPERPEHADDDGQLPGEPLLPQPAAGHQPEHDVRPGVDGDDDDPALTQVRPHRLEPLQEEAVRRVGEAIPGAQRADDDPEVRGDLPRPDGATPRWMRGMACGGRGAHWRGRRGGVG